MMMRILLMAVFLMGVVALAFPDVLGVDIRLPDRAEIDRWIEAAGLAVRLPLLVWPAVSVVPSLSVISVRRLTQACSDRRTL